MPATAVPMACRGRRHGGSHMENLSRPEPGQTCELGCSHKEKLRIRNLVDVTMFHVGAAMAATAALMACRSRRHGGSHNGFQLGAVRLERLA